MLKKFLLPHFWFAYAFFLIALLFGLLYSLQLLGIGASLFRPDLARSMHLTLMLYSFLPLMMTVLPFALFEKEGVLSADSLRSLSVFFVLWYLFLLFAMLAIARGDTRGLPFYDFPYELNVLLAFAGIFYIRAIFQSIAHYAVKPLWVKVSLILVVISPVALLVLMNPTYGQVSKTLVGPHGDNTLGMSFALVILYYLTIKLSSDKPTFRTRWHLLWQIPLGFYMLSVLYRTLVGPLTYNMEWFLQYLTLLYIPLLYRWWKDAKLDIRKDFALFLSITAFLFADVEGNILYIPHIRALFHRNDLVVGHAHIAVGMGFLFLVLAIVKESVSFSRKTMLLLTVPLLGMALVLSLSGFEEAGFWSMHTTLWWSLRSVFGVLFSIGVFTVAFKRSLPAVKEFYRHMRPVDLYHLAGFLSDGIGGVILLFFGKALYRLLDIPFHEGYIEIVFGFVAGVGAIHLSGLFHKKEAYAYAQATALLRAFTAAGFFALYKASVLDRSALGIAFVDLLYVLVYLLFLKDTYEKDTLD